MKKVALFATILFTLGAVTVRAYNSPGKPQGFVNDFAKILSTNATTQLEAELSDFERNSSIQISVVTVPTLADETIETYTVKLFEEWGIGNKEKDNGVLFLIAPIERKVRIEVGYGLEGALTDAQSNGIIQSIVLPEFKAGNLEKGIVDGTSAIISVVKGEGDYSGGSNSRSNVNLDSYAFWFWIIVGFLGGMLGKTKSWWLGGLFGAISGIIIGFIYGFIFTGIISILVLTIFGLIFDYFVSKGDGKGGGGLWFLGGGRGESGGGFGGFGGGRSGGGGSSGSW